jgi:hypothetical protein
MVVATAIETELKRAQSINDCFVVPNFVADIQDKFDADLIKLCTELYVAAKNLNFEECEAVSKKISGKMFQYQDGSWKGWQDAD